MTYQWQKGSTIGNMLDIPGANGATYTTPSTTLADHLTLFRCLVSNDSGMSTTASELLFVLSHPSAPSIASPLTAAAQTGVAFRYTIAAAKMGLLR